jgi:nicotinamidase-related amidase
MSIFLSASPTILVCCDLQESCSPADAGSSLATVACHALLARWRKLRWPVAHLKRMGQRQWLARDADEWIEAFRPRPDELTFLHHLPSAYSSEHFTQYMQSIRDTACVLTGYSLDETILATAVDGYHRNHRYYLATDAVACKVPLRADAEIYRCAVMAIVQNFAGTFQAAGAALPPLAGVRGQHDQRGHPWE